MSNTDNLLQKIDAIALADSASKVQDEIGDIQAAINFNMKVIANNNAGEEVSNICIEQNKVMVKRLTDMLGNAPAPVTADNAA